MSQHKHATPPRSLNGLIGYLTIHPRVRCEADRGCLDVTFSGVQGNTLWFATPDGERRGVRLFSPGYYETGLDFRADGFAWSRGPCAAVFWYLRDTPQGEGGRVDGTEPG